MLKNPLYLLLVIVFAFPVLAETPEEKGLAIVTEADKRDTGWIDSTSNMRMILRNKQGQESERILRIKSREVDGDGDQSLTIFDTPRDVKGTAFLSYTHALTPDDQWLYLPALKRVKRISSSNKSGPFMGSEFAFEDLTSFEVAKYTYKWLRDETLDGVDCFVVEYYPAYKHSGYTRQIAWVNKETYQAEKVEFYDRKDSLLKTLAYKDYKLYLEKFWRPGAMHMVNHQTGKETDIFMEDYKFNNGYTDRDFDQNSLKEAR